VWLAGEGPAAGAHFVRRHKGILVDYFKILGATVVGWLLNEITQMLRGRTAERQAIAGVLSELLEVRHRAHAVRAVIDELKKYPALPPEAVNQAITTALAMVPQSDRSSGSYETAVGHLAAHRPVLAFQLRSHDAIPNIVSTLRQVAGAESTGPGAVLQIERVLEPAFLALLDDSTARLARAHGIRTQWQLRSYNKVLRDLPKAAATMMKEFSPNGG
jgi:hypothetical protein